MDKNEALPPRTLGGNTLCVLALAQAGLVVLKAAGVTHISWWLVSAPLWISALGFLLVIVFLSVVGGYVSASKGYQDSQQSASQRGPEVLPVKVGARGGRGQRPFRSHS